MTKCIGLFLLCLPMLMPVNGEEQQKIIHPRTLLLANSQWEIMGINFGNATPIPLTTNMNTTDSKLGTTTTQEFTARMTTNTPIVRNSGIYSPSSILQQQAPIGLPSFLLSNIQSFGNSEDKDKTTELQCTLDYNKIDIAVLTETWLTDVTKNQVSLDKYTHFFDS